MAITITADKTSPGYLEPVVVTIAGASASTDYVLTAALATGWSQAFNIRTDGSGGATQRFVPQHVGTPTFALRPLAETNGTTTAAATGTPIKLKT